MTPPPPVVTAVEPVRKRFGDLECVAVDKRFGKPSGRGTLAGLRWWGGGFLNMKYYTNIEISIEE